MLNFPFKKLDNSNVSKWSSNSSLRKASNPHPIEKIRTYSVTRHSASQLSTDFTPDNCLPVTQVIKEKELKAIKPIKSNLDIFIDITSNPFTTKFEIIGSSPSRISKQNYQRQLKLPNNVNSSINNLFRVSSTSDLSYSEEAFSNIWQETAGDEKQTRQYNKQEDCSVPTPAKNCNFLTVTQHIYTGSISSIKNERKMCRLGIEYLIDMSNMRPDDLNRQTLGKLPCLCKQQHSRLYLSVQISDTSFKSLFAAFSEVNKFIQRAKRSTDHRNKVLVFGKESLSQPVICACLQYLMVDYQMGLSQALHIIFKNSNQGSVSFRLEACYQTYLEQLQNYLRHLSTTLHPVPDVTNLWPLRDIQIGHEQAEESDSECEEGIGTRFSDLSGSGGGGSSAAGGMLRSSRSRKNSKMAWM